MTIQQIVRLKDSTEYHLSEPYYQDGDGEIVTTKCQAAIKVSAASFTAKNSNETHIPGYSFCKLCFKMLRDAPEVNHPAHYGGADNPYEAIKVIEAWDLGFNLGNCVKYINRAGKKETSNTLIDLQKALWYLRREIERIH